MHNLSRKKANSYYSSKFTDTVMQVAPSPVIRVADTGLPYDDVMKVADTGIQPFHPRRQRLLLLSSQCPDTGIQESLLVSKQTSIESGYNIFDEIIWKTGSQCQALE
ncbi:toluene-4-monooxygenase system B family protein [Wolbachia endosymbiont (group A) of Sphecodes monilicornis]|uniref:toluene-4-monooxygenase system B family protein n=2 Tax=unclassified Wolbachia TaxID=2640676 RepID=UPI002225BE4A|nr:toluene-4-monooxygenase system B family protein [Wolbachia endosymbiont (group A) of Sphecodes monilicornis]